MFSGNRLQTESARPTLLTIQTSSKVGSFFLPVNRLRLFFLSLIEER